MFIRKNDFLFKDWRLTETIFLHLRLEKDIALKKLNVKYSTGESRCWYPRCNELSKMHLWSLTPVVHLACCLCFWPNEITVCLYSRNELKLLVEEKLPVEERQFLHYTKRGSFQWETLPGDWLNGMKISEHFFKDNAVKLFKMKSKSLNKETLFMVSRKPLFYWDSIVQFIFLLKIIT